MPGTVILSESIIPGSCQHPDEAPKPTMKPVPKGPRVAVRWRCGICRDTIATIWYVAGSGQNATWGKSSEQIEGTVTDRPEDEREDK